MNSTHVLLDIAIDSESIERLRALPGVILHEPEISHKPIERPAELLRQVHVLLCKHPPVNIDDLTSLQLMQLATVGYDNLTHLKLGDRPFTVCNARGMFDTAIAEWCAAMMVNLTRDLRGMIDTAIAEWCAA